MSIGKTITPLPGFIVIEEVEADTKTASGLELPDSAQAKPQLGKVIAVGTEQFRDGKYLTIPVKKDQTVAFKKYTGHPVKIEGKEYQVVNFDDVIATID
jgi:chaperonin GroES